MNPISFIVWTMEENFWIVLSALFVTFCFFICVDWIRHEEPVRESDQDRSQRAVRSFEDMSSPEDDDDSPTPALPADTAQVPYRPPRCPDQELERRAEQFYRLMNGRRTVRMFSEEPLPRNLLDYIVRTAGTSPSGAHTEPWTFVIVEDRATKEAIRDIVEEEEELNYSSRMSRQWVADLAPFQTRPVKPYLVEAPALILVFRQTHSTREDGQKRMHYYSGISVAIAAGFLLAAIQYAGLVALTSTPLNCHARLRLLLRRPLNERLELLLPVGRPHPDTTVPDLARKPLDQIAVYF